MCVALFHIDVEMKDQGFLVAHPESGQITMPAHWLSIYSK